MMTMRMPMPAGLAVLFVLSSAAAAAQLPVFPGVFPASQYTPHGYLDNPFHSMTANRSGVIRSYPPLGFGFWRTDFKGSYGGGARDHVNYISLLLLGAQIDGRLFSDTSDFTATGVELVSRYHTKNVMSYDWQYHTVDVTMSFFLPQEHALACLVTLTNRGTVPNEILLHATNLYQSGDVKWWGSDGIAALYRKPAGIAVQKVWAGGDAFVLGADTIPAAAKATPDRRTWRRWMETGDTIPVPMATLSGRGPMYMLETFRVTVPAGTQKSLLVVLSRGKNEMQAAEAFRRTVRSGLESMQMLLNEDRDFWSQCPQLAGDWPETWKHGWVYDFETLRMNVRRPLGIFHHPWDAMQVHAPRSVLGETSMDMMTMSYADPALAREVLFGTFADAIAPNVPCVREDGSVNMVSSDGSECGTAPMWGFPFHVIKAIYQSTGDSAWIAALYPHLKEYIDWWLTNRTDSEGWLHCNNSWESGQDGSRRFLVAEHNEGAVADFVRTVDVEASMAEAMHCMDAFAAIAGLPGDRPRWNDLAQRRTGNTRSMYFNGWFRDVDARTKKPIILNNYFDVMMLTPLACGIADEKQTAGVKPILSSFNRKRPIEWPPGMFVFTEAAWNSGQRDAASEAVMIAAERVYRRIDSRHLLFSDSLFSYRIPGVANEFWPLDSVPAGGENYGWGATLPLFIIRNIIGFREPSADGGEAFILAPLLPREFAVPGKSYSISNLKHDGYQFDLTYIIEKNDNIRISMAFKPLVTCKVIVRDEQSRVIAGKEIRSSDTVLVFKSKNNSVYSVSIQ